MKPTEEIQSITKENLELREAFKRATLELGKKNRELEIEAALEKVRSTSLAMRSSADLGKVVTILLSNLQDLGFTNESGGAAHIMIFTRGTREFVQWSADPFLSSPVRTKVPYRDIPMQSGFFEAKEKGIDFFAGTYSFEQKNEFFVHAFEHSDLKQLPDELKQMILKSETYSNWVAIQENSAVTVNSITGIQLSENQIDILKRFARVFEQSYVRFLDLQKAEAQAKEARIEAALEKVRSRSLAMHRSEELQEVVTAVFDQLKNLDIQTDAINLDVFNDDIKNAYLWTAVPGHTYSQEFRIPYNDTVVFKDIYDGMVAGKVLHSKVYSRKEKDEFLTFIFEHTDFRHIPEERKALLFATEASTVSVAYAKHIAIIAQRYREKLFSEDENEILKRFAKVFEQAYVRFLDLKRAEAQTREARIEAALERVRSKAMAMHKSEDLHAAVAVVFEELYKLKLGVLRVGISVLNKVQRSGNVWLTSIDKDKAVQVSGDESFDIHPLLHGAFEAWLRQEDFYYLLEGDDLTQYYKAVAEAQFRLPESQMLLSETGTRKQYCFVAVYNSGGLFAFRETEFPDEAKKVMRRFAGVFDLTYKRYKDLQQAEALAKQAEEDLVKLKVEKKKTEDALIELKNTQAQLVQSEKMASLGELTAGIAHEIQNPLNFVNNFSDVSGELLDEMLDEVEKGNYDEVRSILGDIKQNLEKINLHGKRADGIVKGMLQHSRSSSGQKEPTDINILVDEYLRLAFHGLRAKDNSFNVACRTDFGKDIGAIEMIPQEIGRVLVNLLNNAFYAVNEKRKKGGNGYEPFVTVSTKKTDDKIEVRVGDNGNGIPAAALEKIFQPFFTTKPTGQGTGLGLSLSYDIIKAHGGELRVETKEEEGTEFTIVLPAI